MTSIDHQLIGDWDRTAEEACAQAYAAHLRFDPNGVYAGTTETAGGFSWWDGGAWQVASPGRLSLALANDAVVTYDYRIEADRLEITDQTGCRVTYQRA